MQVLLRVGKSTLVVEMKHHQLKTHLHLFSTDRDLFRKYSWMVCDCLVTGELLRGTKEVTGWRRVDSLFSSVRCLKHYVARDVDRE